MNKLVIWDWNGTLLNDVKACVDTMNMMLEKRNMQFLTTDRYKNIFTFPVQKYYESVGFDFEIDSFEELSVEYIDLYKKEALKSPLQIGAAELLEFFKSKGYSQIILSASEQKSLETQVKQRNIFEYFDTLLGLNNIHAKSKLNNALDYINNSSIETDRILLIGDTFHDYEVARAIGSECLLVNNGHQNLNQFEFDNPNIIIDDLREVPELLRNKIYSDRI